MIVITGAAGFIGSVMAWKLNEEGIENIILSDKFHSGEKWRNISKRKYFDWVDRDELFSWLYENGNNVRAVIHMGACSATTEKNMDFLIKNNYEYSKKLWDICVEKEINFIYASSAATYGAGENGYDDRKSIENLVPLNPYGYSKQIFDLWALKQRRKPIQWVGLKFFNVYGPNEYHKGKMSSVIYHAFNQINETGKVKLFKSYKEGFKDGEQKRDFIYVKDVVDVIKFFLENEEKSGIFNLGTGKADTFMSLAENTMEAMERKKNIEFIEMPDELRGKYQYFTEASMEKLKKIGYTKYFHTLNEGIEDYVKNYLMKEDKYI